MQNWQLSPLGLLGHVLRDKGTRAKFSNEVVQLPKSENTAFLCPTWLLSKHLLSKQNKTHGDDIVYVALP